MRLFWITIFLICALGLVGCVPPLDPVVQAFNNAISNLNSQSTSWQATLQNLQAQLIALGKSTLANEVQSVVNRGIATTSAEFRCDVKFLGSELAQALQNILARYQNTTPPGEPPVFCTVDPPVVDLGGTLHPLNIYGFNFSSGVINVTVVDKQHGTTTTPPPGALTLAVTTEFLATLNTVNYTFGASDSFVRFTLPGSPATPLSPQQSPTVWDVNIIQPAATGGPGQACRQPGNVCNVGLGCTPALICAACPPPFVSKTQEAFRKDDEFAGNNLCGPPFTSCTNSWIRTYGGNCDNGFHREQCIVQIRDQCDTCTATQVPFPWPPNSCSCQVAYTTPNDLTKGIHVNIIVTETTNQPPPPPTGCPQ